MAMSLGELFLVLKVKKDASLKKAGTGLKKVGSGAKGASAGILTMGKAFKAALGPILLIVGAITAVVAIFSKAIKAADIQAQAINRMNIALANQGNLLPGTSKRLQEFADEMQRTTKFGDEVILSANAMAASFGAGEKDVMRITRASADMAEVMGIDLKSAVNLVGKAFVGETGSLSRYGIIIDKNIPKGQKFDAVLQQLQTRFGGTAESATQTLGGAFTQLGNALGDIMESVGILIQSFFDMGGGGAGGVQWLTGMVANFATFLRQDLVIAISEAKAQVIEFVASSVSTMAKFQKIVQAVVVIFNQDLADSIGNNIHAMNAFAEEQRLSAEAIRENANQIAFQGTSLQVTNKQLQKTTKDTSDAAFGITSFSIATAESRMQTALMAQEQLLWSEIMKQTFQDVTENGVIPFQERFTKSGDIISASAAKAATEIQASFKRMGIVTRADSALTEAQMVMDLDTIKASGIASAKAIEQAEQKLADFRKMTSEANVAGATGMFESITGAASGALSQLASKNKAWGIATAVVNTAVAVTKALTTLPWPANLISAAGAAAAGAIQISTIKAQSTSGFVMGTPGLDFQDFGAATQTFLHGEEAVIPKGGGNALASEIASALAPIQAAQTGGNGSSGRGGDTPASAGPVTIIFELDGRQVGRALIPTIEDLTKRRELRIHTASLKEF